jgi:ANTAR domain/GAF domain
LTGFASSATGSKGTTMPIDPSMLARSIATLTDLDPERDLASTLEQAVVAAKPLFAVDAAGIMLADADGRLRWANASDPLAQTLEDNQEAFAAGPCLQAFASGQPAVIHDATLEPRWGEITLAFVATLLGTAAKAERSGALAQQLQVALDTRNLIERAKGALMDRERPDDQQAVIDLRRAARPSRREVADGPVVALPLPHGRSKPAGPATDGALPLDMGPWAARSPPSWNGTQASMGSGTG